MRVLSIPVTIVRTPMVLPGEERAWAACVDAALSIKSRPLADAKDTEAFARALWRSGETKNIAEMMDRICGVLESAR